MYEKPGTRPERKNILHRWFPQLFEPYTGPLVKPARAFDGRQQWSTKWDFLMACTGYAVGLGNIWRFPYLCFKNGGGAFLLPYLAISLTCGVSLSFLEIALGQFLGQGCVTCWKLCPLFKGIGYGIIVLCNWLNIYYIVVLAWSLYYLGMSFNSVLPWSHCNHTWNTEYCTTGNEKARNITIMYNETSMLNYTTIKLNDSVEEFWKIRILKLTSGIHDLGGMNWEMVCCLFVAWLLNYFIIWKGVKVSGKIVYFTALFPYLMLFILIIRGITLDGAIDGIIFYIRPNFSKILEAEVWMDAGTQIFFAYAVSTGALIAMGSYNRFNNDCYWDTWFICIVNTVTSILSGFCVFAILGYMARQTGKLVKDVVDEGPGLAFIAYPKALSQMPVAAPVWSVLFFFMLCLLGIDSEFVGLEGVFAAFLDMFPELRHGIRPELIMGSACTLCFTFGLLFCTHGGMYVFQLFDYYSASGFVLLWFCFFECFVVSWFYGGQRFYADITMMIGYKISHWMLFCWAVIAPLTSSAIFFVSLLQHTPIKYGESYIYPVWADALGWCIALSSMICVPIYFVYKLAITPGASLREKFSNAIRPEYVACATSESNSTLKQSQSSTSAGLHVMDEAARDTTRMSLLSNIPEIDSVD